MLYFIISFVFLNLLSLSLITFLSVLFILAMSFYSAVYNKHHQILHSYRSLFYSFNRRLTQRMRAYYSKIFDTTFLRFFTEQVTCKVGKKINTLFAGLGRSVLEKIVPLLLSTYSRPLVQFSEFLPIRTSRLANNVFVCRNIYRDGEHLSYFIPLLQFCDTVGMLY